MKINLSGIRARLLLIIITLMIVSLGIQTGISYYFSKQALSKSVDETAAAIGTDYANRVQASTNELIIYLQDLTTNPNIRNGSDRQQIVGTLAEAMQRSNKFTGINYGDLSGNVVRAQGDTAYLGDREYYQKAIRTKKIAVSDLLIAKGTGKLSLGIAVPVIVNGNLTGVLQGTVPLDSLNDMIKDIKFKESGYGVIADKTGMIIAYAQHPELNGKLSLTEKKVKSELNLGVDELDDKLISFLKSTIENGQQVQGTHMFISNTPMMSVFTPINLPGDQHWVIMVSAPETEVTSAVNSLSMILFTAAIICILLGSFVIVYISIGFTRPITKMRDEALLLAEGDLRYRENNINSKDEIGQLAEAFGQMSAKLRNLVVNVQSKAETVAASSEELTASADQSAQAANQVAISITDVATGVSEQMEAARETTAVVEQMVTNIQQIAVNANLVAAQSGKAVDNAKDGGQAVERAIVQMGKIETTVNSSAQVVIKLGERSKEIGQIVATISGIAGQTNLLALNAAIEAARAGEQGRGFAVVAEEVRKLAEQSQEAAKKIAELIGEIQGDTDKAVAAMNDGTREVKNGTDVVNTAGASFREIVNLVSEVSSQVKDISVAMQQMAVGSQQIVGSVKKIDELGKMSAGETQSVSAAAEEQLASMEEIASSSQALAKLADDLQTSVAGYRV